ncbi:hybrid sensor histidine kinase/response regulator [Paramagnetospirillum marisnigri]|uniref:histidine kinase n=1 Tax=Paramagnetospirillum marisnigri TaxID=1285242 RepID=A0A178MUH3_9PROT|nr:ATP-binding protein [Paramagnetospirillum marisnigri]OAN53717.1 hybrid sensor histidine kinase/response regulator [Paramagnetospirillum marisnigri]
MTSAVGASVGDRRLGVLVVDDEPQILTAISDLLDPEFRVWTASDGAAALEILERADVAVILSDQRMPGMTGAEFLGRARSLSEATRVLVTGYSDLDALVTAVNLGQIHAYLSKPWNPLELKVVVRAAADRWRLGRSLDQERNLLRSLMGNIPDAISFKDRTLTFTRLNRAAAAMLGAADPQDIVGMRLGELLPPDRASRVEAEERGVIETGLPVTDQLEEVADSQGESRWFSVTKAPIWQDGIVTGLVAVARDVTLRKEAEDYLRHARDRLQEAVDERTLWLQQEVRRRADAEAQAQAAREAAETANRAKTIFLANMSHELRTPLNAILGFSELAASIMDPPAQERYGGFLDNITESAQHLLRVISDILDVSRVEVGKVVLRESDVDLADAVRSVRRLIEHVVLGKRQTLDSDVPDGLPRLRGDARLIKQILLNLVSNAAKFTPENGHIRVAASLRDGGVVVVVEDDGVGIAPEDLSMVLQPFGQAENTISPKHEGTGLGLPLAKGFAELHGGSLALDSEPGRGTRVTVIFPATRTVI